MADPLSLLREYVSTGRLDDVALSGDRVDFAGKFTFSKNSATGYKSQQGKGDFYTLGTLLFFARNIAVKFGEYFKKAQKEGVAAVTFVDRKDLQDYLTGKTDRSEYIQLAALPPLEVEHPAKRARLEAGGEAAAAGPGLGAAAGDEEAEEEAAEMAALRKVRETELQLRDRNSMLSVPGRSFRRVLTIVAQAQQKQQAWEHAEAAKSKRHAPKPLVPVRPSGRYERQTQQDATLKQLGAAELGVQVGFKPSAQVAAANGAPPPPPPEQQGAAPPPPPGGASSSRHAQQQRHQQQQQHSRHSGGSGSRPPAPGQQRSAPPRPGHPNQQQAPVRQGTPIIMVPPGMTALLNMHNIRGFLERGEFQTTEQAKAATAEAEAKAAADAAKSGRPYAPPKKEERVAMQRTIGRKGPVKYYITDKEPSRKEDWHRVVAVICMGKAWQFKKWPFKGAESGDLVETFSRVLGVFLHYTDEQVDATVKSWNVKILGLNRQSRHRDATVAQEFWQMLDAHLQARASTLKY